MSQIKIREVPKEERPREKLAAHGAAALIRAEEVSLGSVKESIALPRDVFRPALVASAYAVIVVHNHPSGDASPSQTDHSLTRRPCRAAELLQIKLLDHIIIGAPGNENPGYFSFKEVGVL